MVEQIYSRHGIRNSEIDTPKETVHPRKEKHQTGRLLERPRIGVIGGGVVGLFTGIEALSRGYEVTLYEAERYDHRLAQTPEVGPTINHRTSEVGIAQWFPDFDRVYPADVMQKRDDWMHWALDSYLNRLMSDSYSDAMRKRQNIELMREPTPLTRRVRALLERIGTVKEFEADTPNDTPYRGGIDFQTISFNTPAMLAALKQEFEESGGSFVTRKIHDRKEIDGLPQEVIINCMGLGAKELFPELGLQAVKGHTIILENPGIKTVVSADDLQLHPRTDGRLVMGALYLPEGTFGTDEPTEAEAIDIMTRNKIMVRTNYPALLEVAERLAKAKVLGHTSGFRPVRKEGILVQAQKLGRKIVVHNVGHGGEGWSLAPGTAKEAINIVENL